MRRAATTATVIIIIIRRRAARFSIYDNAANVTKSRPIVAVHHEQHPSACMKGAAISLFQGMTRSRQTRGGDG